MLRFPGYSSSRIRGGHIAAPRLMVPQNIVDDAHLSGRFTFEAGMCFGIFIQVNTWKWCKSNTDPTGYVIQENGCWDWVGCTNKKGYGKLCVKRRYVFAHRWTYEQAKGPIPSGLQLDHLCRNRKCVNPDHLEAVTLQENARRGETISTLNRRKTHCPQGHPYNDENTYRHRGGRLCRVCSAVHCVATRKRRVAKRPNA